MEKKDYDKLNSYLNDIFIVLNNGNHFLTKNIVKIWHLNSDYMRCIEQHDLTQKIKENKLTCEEICLLAREIIESIDSSYLKDYDELIKTGKLDFGYEDEYDDSEFVHKHNLINIKREFNYDDVIALVHEFMHYINGSNKKSQNRYLLTEFLSIYFEIYAIDYLIEKGVSKDEIGVHNRLNWTIGHSRSLYTYEIIFLAYEKFGVINEETVDYLNQYFIAISKESFDKECMNLLEVIGKKERDYKIRTMYEKEFKSEEFIYELCDPFSRNYRYLLGTLLAYYAREHCKMEDIVYLNNHINDENIGDLNLSILLKKIGIAINNPEFGQQALDSIENYIKQYNNEKSR